jgi:hypothetical protein
MRSTFAPREFAAKDIKNTRISPPILLPSEYLLEKTCLASDDDVDER